MMELRSPIRLYWDVTPAPDPLPDYDRICSEIASSRAMTLHLTDLGTAVAPETLAIIARLSTSTLQLALTVAHSAAAGAVSLLSHGVKKLYSDAISPEEVATISRMAISGVSFRTTRANHRLLPDMITSCIENRIAEMQLPMERLIAGEEPLCLSTDERETLAARIAPIPFAGRLTITANDPFLWRVVHPETPFPDGICQAANTMLALDPSGNLYPCPAMPILLGNLHRSTFREIVASSLKKEVRARIVARPSDCMGCRMLDGCRGGCRGRGLTVQGSLDAGDPGCGVV